jgi:hypothetical protein
VSRIADALPGAARAAAAALTGGTA